MRRLAFALLILTGLALAQAPNKPPAIEGSPTRTLTGLEYWDIQLGTGRTAKFGDDITVNYTGWLESNGKKFDSSLDRRQPFHMTIGSTPVIKGWVEGLRGMKVGGKRRLRVPSQLGYGTRGAVRDIPPCATLIFDIELLDAR
jgi:FKBP-type peptidyl-prolyl cis-trans isomerase